jgi:uncharacterized membrane protein
MDAQMGSDGVAWRRPIKRVWDVDVRSLAAIALVTATVTVAFMQLEGPAPEAGRIYETPTWAIALHVGTVIPALAVGLIVLTSRKGGAMHRRLGAVWIGMMVTTAVASFWIRGEGGGMSGIHLFSIGTLIAAPMAIWRARVRDIRAHQQIMASLYIGLIVAGVFALDPNRIAGQFVWGLLRGG